MTRSIIRPVVIRLPWFTLYGLPKRPGRIARLRCAAAMLVHEVVELTLGTDLAHSMAASARYSIGAPTISVPASRRGLVYYATAEDPLPSLADPPFNGRTGLELHVYASGVPSASRESIYGYSELLYVLRSNALLGTWDGILGTAAASDTGDFATAAQGSTADSAVQPGDIPTFGDIVTHNAAEFDAAGAAAAVTPTSLGLVIGTNVQAYDADLSSIAALVTDSFGRTLLTKTSSSEVRSYIGLVLGTDVQAYSANLTTLAGIASSAIGQTILAAANAAAVRTAIGVVIGTDVQAYDADLAAIAGVTSAANKIPYFTGSATASLLTLDTDGTLAANSDTTLPSQKAVKTYVDGLSATRMSRSWLYWSYSAVSSGTLSGSNMYMAIASTGYLEWTDELEAGTWRFQAHYTATNSVNSSTLQLAFNGVNLGSTMSTYLATNTPVVSVVDADKVLSVKTAVTLRVTAASATCRFHGLSARRVD